MSDTGSGDLTPRRTPQVNRNHTRRFPADFPVRTGRATATQDELQRIIAGEIANDLASQSTSYQEAVANIIHQTQASHQTLTNSHQTVQQQDTVPMQAGRGKSGTKSAGKPITTIVSALPETPYKDEDDKSGENSLAYIKVQRSLLKWLGTNAADSLLTGQASIWTAAIEPATKQPKAADALRLCYYMRSQGFDTYATINKEDGTMSLFVVNQKSHERSPWTDFQYWHQNLSTQEITLGTPSGDEGHPSGRRNALGAYDFVGAEAPDLEMLLNHLRGSEVDSAQAGSAQAAEDGQQAQPGEPNLRDVLAEAERNVNRLLSSDHADPA
jgi:hypothetical protein